MGTILLLLGYDLILNINHGAGFNVSSRQTVITTVISYTSRQPTPRLSPSLSPPLYPSNFHFPLLLFLSPFPQPSYPFAFTARPINRLSADLLSRCHQQRDMASPRMKLSTASAVEVSKVNLYFIPHRPSLFYFFKCHFKETAQHEDR